VGTSDDVRALQATIVERTGSIFEQLSQIASDASGQALGVDIDASVVVPAIPTVNITSGKVQFIEGSYASTLYTAVLNRLVSEITTGDYGLDAWDEARLFDRARERELELTASAADEAVQLHAAGGFSIPTGAATAARAKVLKEGRDKVSDLNRDFLSKMAALHLEGKGQVLMAANQLEQTTQQAFAAKMERKLKAVVQDLVSLVEAAVGEGNIAVAAAKVAVEAALGAADLKVKAAIAKASVFAQVASAGMSGLHVNATLGADANASESFQGQVSESTSYNHDYQEK
jgi:hypothetical protein